MYKSIKLLKSLQIKKDDLVLEIGSGSNPIIRSDILLDKYPIVSKEHRTSLTIADIDERPFIVGDAQELPFVDKSFDLVICRHVLEHLPNPQRFILEIKRVSKAIFIATPSPFTELVHGGYQSIGKVHLEKGLQSLHHGKGTLGHQWFVLATENKIYMLAKSSELYPIYLLFGYFVKKRTNYKQVSFFRANPDWQETIFLNKNIDEIGLLIIKDIEDKTEKAVDIDELISLLKNISSNMNLKGAVKSFLRKTIFSTKKRFNVYELLACPICKEKVIKEENRLTCSNCGYFPIVNNIPILLKEALKK